MEWRRGGKEDAGPGQCRGEKKSVKYYAFKPENGGWSLLNSGSKIEDLPERSNRDWIYEIFGWIASRYAPFASG